VIRHAGQKLIVPATKGITPNKNHGFQRTIPVIRSPNPSDILTHLQIALNLFNDMNFSLHNFNLCEE
jgi:hypothetical protein